MFMVLTAIALERAVVKRALQSEEDGLQLLIYSLLAAVDRDEQGLSLTVSENRLFEPSLMTHNSGLDALLYDSAQQEIWRSESITFEFPATADLELGKWAFEIVDRYETPYFRLGFALQWPDIDNQLQRYDVVVWRNAEGSKVSLVGDPLNMFLDVLRVRWHFRRGRYDPRRPESKLGSSGGSES